MAKRGRPPGTGADLSDHLVYMADLVCSRAVTSERKAARRALKVHGNVVSERQLTRAYAGRRRELEMDAMETYAVWRF